MNAAMIRIASRPVICGRDGSCHLWRVGRACIALLGLMGVAGAGPVAATSGAGHEPERTVRLQPDSNGGLSAGSGQTSASMPAVAGRRIAVNLDRFGRYCLDGHPVERLDIFRELRDVLSRHRGAVVDVTVAPGALPADVAELTEVLRQGAEGNDRTHVNRANKPAIRPNDSKAAVAFIVGQVELHGALLERIAAGRQRLVSQAARWQAELARRATVARTYVDRLGNWLRTATGTNATTRRSR